MRGIKIVLFLLGIAGTSQFTLAQSLPDSLELIYEVSLGVAELGSLSSKLTKKQEDFYEVTAETRAEGMASILLGGTVRETCSFTVNENAVVPNSYRIVREGRDAFDRSAEFIWDERSVQLSNGEKVVIPEGYIVDNCSIPYAYMIGGAEIFENRNVHIVGGSKVRQFEHIGLSEDRVTTPLGEFDTVKIEQVRFERPDRKLTVWLAPEKNNLPVKIVEQRSSRPDTTMLLRSADGL